MGEGTAHREVWVTGKDMRCSLTARLGECGVSIHLGSPQQREVQILVVYTGVPMPVLKEQHDLLAVACGD